MENKIKIGTEVIFNGMTWGIVDAIEDGILWVLDQDGGEHELTVGQLDAINP